MGNSVRITCLVTDGAPNMLVCGRELRPGHEICIGHTLNLIVKKALDLMPVLSSIRAKARTLVGYFKSSTTAKVVSLMLFSYLLMHSLFYNAANVTVTLFTFLVFKGEACTCSEADGEAKAKTALGG